MLAGKFGERRFLTRNGPAVNGVERRAAVVVRAFEEIVGRAVLCARNAAQFGGTAGEAVKFRQRDLLLFLSGAGAAAVILKRGVALLALPVIPAPFRVDVVIEGVPVPAGGAGDSRLFAERGQFGHERVIGEAHAVGIRSLAAGHIVKGVLKSFGEIKIHEGKDRLHGGHNGFAPWRGH